MGYREDNTRSSLSEPRLMKVCQTQTLMPAEVREGNTWVDLANCKCHSILTECCCVEKSSESQNIRFFKGSQKSRFKCEFSILKMLLKFLLFKHLVGQKTVSICHQIKFCTILIVPVSLTRTVEKARGITVEETSQILNTSCEVFSKVWKRISVQNV